MIKTYISNNYLKCEKECVSREIMSCKESWGLCKGGTRMKLSYSKSSEDFSKENMAIYYYYMRLWTFVALLVLRQDSYLHIITKIRRPPSFSSCWDVYYKWMRSWFLLYYTCEHYWWIRFTFSKFDYRDMLCI